LAQKEIRLQYSGFVVFAAKFASEVAGLIFQFIIVRSLSAVSMGNKTEYDYWLNVNDVGTYFTLVAGVLPFWIMRFAVRKKKGSVKTGIFANLVISAIATLIYLLLVPFITSALGISVNFLLVYFLMSLQIVESYTITVLEACIQTRIPQAVGYGLIVQHVSKVILSYVLIIMLNRLILGAAIATIVGFVPQIIYYLKLLSPEFKEKIEWNYVKEWVKGSLINIYNVIGSQAAAYILIMLFPYGSQNSTQMGARGIFGAAQLVAAVITYSSFLAFALYPRLLAERNAEDITTSLKMVLMFAIPMTVGAVALSDSYMRMLSAPAASASVLVVLSIDSFVSVISGLLGTVVYGFDTVDEGTKMSLRQLVRSRIFLAFSLPYVQAAITLPSAYFALTTYAQNQPVQAALYASVINSAVHFSTFLVLYVIARKMIKISIPWRNIGKYASATAVMGAILYAIPHSTRVYVNLIETAIGGAVYMALLMAIDKEARSLPRSVLKEIRHPHAENKDERLTFSNEYS
jgi:hypothetical protein